ncbi:sulfotransferase 1C2-like [Mytilus galloprovincialis]|uniref:sulfotransferase 1C2-like n=1 Tax=Mytilus galloprovincialis TaxID=29158 RepID=UPI003F7B3D14
MTDTHDVPLKVHNESVTDSNLVIYPFTRLGNETFISGPAIKEHGIEKNFKTIRTLKTKDTDILLCTAMKSGTHWCHEILSMLLSHTTGTHWCHEILSMLLSHTTGTHWCHEILSMLLSHTTGTHWCHEILSMLLSHTTEYNTKGVLHHMLLDIAAHFFDKLDDMEDPRLFTTHLPLHHLPDHHVKNGYKIIYLNRNPKDRWVSNYTFLHGKLGIPDWTWNEFFDKMILKDDLQGGWFNFTKGF